MPDDADIRRGGLQRRLLSEELRSQVDAPGADASILVFSDEEQGDTVMLANQFNTRPLYQQVADEFVSRIVSGAWAPGQSIENEAELARSLGISLGTVRKAFEILGEYELLQRHQGKGTVVADLAARTRFSNIRDAGGARLSGETSISDTALATPSEPVAAKLGVNQRTPILAFRRRRVHEGRVFMVEDVFLRVGAEAQAMSPGELAALADTRWSNMELATSMREQIAAGACPPAEAALMGIDPGAPVLMLDRLISSYRGKALELRQGRCNLGEDLFYLPG